MVKQSRNSIKIILVLKLKDWEMPAEDDGDEPCLLFPTVCGLLGTIVMLGFGAKAEDIGGFAGSGSVELVS